MFIVSSRLGQCCGYNKTCAKANIRAEGRNLSVFHIISDGLDRLSFDSVDDFSRSFDPCAYLREDFFSQRLDPDDLLVVWGTSVAVEFIKALNTLSAVLFVVGENTLNRSQACLYPCF